VKNILGKKMQKAVIWALGRPVVLLFRVLGGGWRLIQKSLKKVSKFVFFPVLPTKIA